MAAKEYIAPFPTTPSDREFVITCLVNAPRSLVFEAWIQPELLKQWWGPRGFKLSACDIDLRVGGAYRIVQRGPDGREYAFHGVYREISAPDRLVCTEVFEGSPEAESLNTVTFEELGGVTKITETIRHKTIEDRDAHICAGMEEGMREVLERLAEHLDAMKRKR